MTDLNEKHRRIIAKAAAAVRDRGHEGDARLADSLHGILASLASADESRRAPAAAPAPVAAITDEIPTWEEAEARFDEGKGDYSALDFFIYSNEPAGDTDETLFRAQLQAAITEVRRAALSAAPQAQAAQQPEAPATNARLMLLLSAASGYEARHEYGRITPDQWGDVMRVCEGTLKSTPAAPVAPSEQEKRYTCAGKGGEYVIVGTAKGAGTSRINADLIVYRDVADGTLYFRNEEDFARRMEPAAAPAAPDEG